MSCEAERFARRTEPHVWALDPPDISSAGARHASLIRARVQLGELWWDPASEQYESTSDALKAAPAWMAASDMPAMPRAWYWAAFPGTWVFYAPERNASLGIDHGDLRWHSLESTHYWGPWTPPPMAEPEQAT